MRRKNIFDIHFTEFGAVMTTVLPVLFKYCYNKRLLHDIVHIGPGISPRLPYQARQRSWRADTRDDMENFMS